MSLDHPLVGHHRTARAPRKPLFFSRGWLSDVLHSQESFQYSSLGWIERNICPLTATWRMNFSWVAVLTIVFQVPCLFLANVLTVAWMIPNGLLQFAKRNEMKICDLQKRNLLEKRKRKSFTSLKLKKNQSAWVSCDIFNATRRIFCSNHFFELTFLNHCRVLLYLCVVKLL